MAEDTSRGSRVLETFSSEVKAGRMPEPGRPPYGMLQMSYRSEADQEVYESAAPDFLSNIKSGFVGFEDCALNLTILEFAPGFLLPLHSHKADCLYYVERGTVLMGSRVLGPGEGFLARADRPYGYQAGPEGARVIEFRNGFTLDFTLQERNVSAWKERFRQAVG